MTLGERLLQYRNRIHMSQEQLAEKIGVTRQTISKWETDQSTPDFNKIEPLCEIFHITPDELIKGESVTNKTEEKEKTKSENKYNQKRNKMKAIILSVSIFLYCIATFSLPYMTEVLRYEDAHAIMIWATLCTIATVMLVYFFVAYPKSENEKEKDKGIEKDIQEIHETLEEIDRIGENASHVKVIGTENKTESLVIEIIAMFFLIVYLIVSFVTMAWHITWILWIAFAFVELIVKLIFDLKKEKTEK